jgi:hypothetical protein
MTSSELDRMVEAGRAPWSSTTPAVGTFIKTDRVGGPPFSFCLRNWTCGPLWPLWNQVAVYAAPAAGCAQRGPRGEGARLNRATPLLVLRLGHVDKFDLASHRNRLRDGSDYFWPGQATSGCGGIFQSDAQSFERNFPSDHFVRQ